MPPGTPNDEPPCEPALPSGSERHWLRTWLRVLTLRFDAADIASLNTTHLVPGFLAVWAVGVGRYWDSPRAEPLQRFGVGSLLYVPVLAFLLWVVAQSLRPRRGGYVKLLTFLSLTAPPAAVYAIPVERWVSMRTAQDLNAWALGLVALWRVAMYTRYLRVWNGLPYGCCVIALLLPIAGIIVVLAALNLEHVVFNLMAGIQDYERSVNDERYQVVIGLAYLSILSSPFLLLAWLVAVVVRRGDEHPERFAQKDAP